MTGSELKDARERLGLSVSDLAAEIGLTAHVVEAWEAGRVAVPERYAGEITWRVEAAKREAGLAESGLPVCQWVQDFERAAESRPARSQKELIRNFEGLVKHASNCPTCKARESYVAERFGPMPPRPLPGIVGVIGRIDSQVSRLPQWARPIAWGALIFLAMSAFRILLFSPQLFRQQGGWLIALGALGVSIALGAAVGAVVSAYRAIRGQYSKS